MEQIIFQGRNGDIEVERVDRNVEFNMDQSTSIINMKSLSSRR